MGIKFSVLASGSTGNAMVVQSNETQILIDAGLSAKKIESLMQERGATCADLEGVLVTHEHSDHIKGLGALSRKYKLPIYANQKTWDALNKSVGKIEEHHRKVIQTESQVDFGSLKVDSYSISHDAAEPVGYCFCEDDQKLSLVTDIGYMSQNVKDKVVESDVIIIESNHDIEMLRMGRYPWNIKRRILGDLGHLSNEAAGEALCEIMSTRTKRVYLAHLSRDHNLMDLARLTVENVLNENEISLKERKIKLKDTYFDRATEWDDLSTG
ncbi:MBL fold metallo-hydrolase [Chengkuizengella axinellae]|uniref:MBL fold metallo-hydrolase n=1 Tax=Chengkuizengella axinellae TaxID=3064388 RepID=A0ABT9J366_9BACL|nr:MBL fold metallo-hydrolase [Chengkuizengella sp. 2205SS18-9]MDP5276049.1 MBL fold metallo-hydrolase [Chengkuizengella sp. 2205SS18-9]